MVSIPGAMTPTEIVQAAQWGASVVKVFPAGNLGPDYIKAVRGPLDHIPLCAVGGVDHNNLEEFHRAGVTCFGVGSNIVRKELLAAGNYAAIRENCPALYGAGGNMVNNDEKSGLFWRDYAAAEPARLFADQADDFFEASYAGGEANVAVSLVNYGDQASFVTKLPRNDLTAAALRQAAWLRRGCLPCCHGR